MSKHAVTVVIPVHNASDRLDKVVAWRVTLDKCGHPYELLVVDDGSTDGTAEKLHTREPRARVLRHDKREGFGACLRTALAETKHPLFFYTALDYPYTPTDIRQMFERIELKDDVLGKQADLVSGCRTGLQTPFVPRWTGRIWRGFWRIFAGMPIEEPPAWHGWREFWYKNRVKWVYGVPLADVNSCFKLFRTAFLKRFPIQSSGDFVHTELVAKATFLTSIMDEVKLTPKPDAVPPLGPTATDARCVFSHPQFTDPPFKTEPPPESPQSGTPSTLPPAPPKTEPPPTDAASSPNAQHQPPPEVNTPSSPGSAPAPLP
jgi:glycosyltransferase involved in cell wall biosynthesis